MMKITGALEMPGGRLATLLLLAAILPSLAAAQIVTEDLTQGVSAEDLAGLLAGKGVTVSNVNYVGERIAAGRFSGGDGIIGFENGVILSSGSIRDVVGPNDDPDRSTLHGRPGDPDLDGLSGFTTNDAAVLEFDFVPNNDTLFIQYVFASEEYNEFVGGTFNDVFAFFINGENCATVGSLALPVSINTVNNGNPGDSNPATNPELFIDNDPHNPTMVEIADLDTEMDGLTVLLTCEAAVNVGETNHIKLAIADASDFELDSVVFLRAEGITTGLSDLSVEKIGTPNPVSVGDQLTYQITVANNGPSEAIGVALIDTLPAGVTFVSDDVGCAFAGGVVTCELGNLASGASASVELVVIPNTGGVTLVNTAAVVADEPPDPNPDNNTATEATVVLAPTLLPQADVASDPDGEFLVAWEASDVDRKGIFAQLYAATGEPLTGEFQVNADSAGEQTVPAVASLGGGRYAVAYVSYLILEAQSVVAQIVDATGPVGASIQVVQTDRVCNQGSAICRVLPSLSADPAGNFVVTWDGDGDFEPTFTSFGRRYGADGVAQTEAFPIFDDSAESLTATPDVAVFEDGSFVAVVERINGGEMPADDVWEVHFDAATMPAPASQINLYTPERQAYPNVSALTGGGYVALWESGSSGDATGTGIFGRINPTDPIQPEFQVNSIVDGDQSMPDVAGDAIGGFSAVWLDRERGEIIGQRFDNTGDLVDGEIQISGASSASLSRPRIAALPEQKLAVVWGAEGTQLDPDGEIFVEVLDPPAAAQCVENDTVLCLNANRFRLQAKWTAPDGTHGEARVTKLNVDSGYFWFFSPDNVELAVKVLQACDAAEPCFWVFAGGMTDVEVELSVIDTLTGELKTYVNPMGQSFQPVIDTLTFKATGDGNGAAVRGTERGGARVLYPAVAAAKSESVCGGSVDSLCLDEDRFRIEIEWGIPSGDSGAAHPVPLTDAAGYFWFFSPNNLETVFKVLDGCAINGHYWVFGAGLTNLEVQATVTDTVSGAIANYVNPQGRPFEPILDTEALATCP